MRRLARLWVSDTDITRFSSSTASVSCPSVGALRRWRAGRERQLGHDAGHGQRQCRRPSAPADHAARLVVRVGGDVGHGVDAPGRHAGLLPAPPAPRPPYACTRPGADGGVDLVHPGHAAGALSARPGRPQVVAADGGHQPLEDAVAIAGDQHVGRRRSGRHCWARCRAARCRRAAHGAKGAVLGQQAFHAVEDRLVQRHVDHLARPGCVGADAVRACSASSTPITPCSAASVSPMLTPTRTGTRPGSPSGGAGRPWPRPPRQSRAGRGRGRSGRSR
jgi:hypothetical protein